MRYYCDGIAARMDGESMMKDRYAGSELSHVLPVASVLHGDAEIE